MLNNILDYSINDLLFSHWFRRMSDILGTRDLDGITGVWKGNKSQNPIPLHKIIDDRLDYHRPLCNPNISHLIFDYKPEIYNPPEKASKNKEMSVKLEPKTLTLKEEISKTGKLIEVLNELNNHINIMIEKEELEIPDMTKFINLSKQLKSY